MEAGVKKAKTKIKNKSKNKTKTKIKIKNKPGKAKSLGYLVTIYAETEEEKDKLVQRAEELGYRVLVQQET
jgi:hypothetical protein